MLEQNKTSKIDSLDFGVSLKKESEGSKNLLNVKKFGLNFSHRNSLKVIFASKTRIVKLYKFTSNSLNRLKWNFSRSIFFGRGVYFKYISSLALLIVVLFGAFVYLGYDKGTNGFISKYAGVSASSSGVIFNPGGQTVIAQKQFKVTQYYVQPGDTLSSIAAKYSSSDNVITVDSIMWANGLKSSDILRTGDKLDIPPVSGVLHTVKKGDTVIALAKKYKLTNDKSSAEEINGASQQIIDLNLLDIKVVQTESGESRVPELVEGQRIIIPGGVIVPEASKFAAATNTTGTVSSSTPQLPQQKAPAGQAFIWPVYGGAGSISQYYSAWHRALDIADRSSPFLVSMADGYVEFAGFSEPLCSIAVRIVYDNGYSSVYCHLSSVDAGITAALKSGRVRVTQGQIVGRMGCSGACTGTHVHMNLKTAGVDVNPCSLEPFRSRCYR